MGGSAAASGQPTNAELMTAIQANTAVLHALLEEVKKDALRKQEENVPVENGAKGQA
jgi:hypothetical protein